MTRITSFSTVLLLCACGEDASPGALQPLSCSDVRMENVKLRQGAPSYSQWRDEVAERLPDGQWVFEKDILIDSEDQLRSIFLQTYSAEPASASEGSNFRSIVSCEEGFDNVWSVSEKLDLTYCFGRFTDNSLRANVEAIMPKATMDWERAGDVNFIHVSMTPDDCECIFLEDAVNDPNCVFNTNRARIRIRQANLDNGHPALANFPSSETPELKVDTPADDTNEKLYRLITHELGHLLGLMHEHYRYPQSLSWCENDSAGSWRQVTDPDGNSIMGYGTCAGILGASSPDVVSPLDRQGLASLYNIPRNEFPSFTAELRDDILWYIPSTNKYHLWRSSQNPQGLISFPDREEFCGAGGCASGHYQLNRPIPVALTDERLTDVISYGPGTANPQFVSDDLLLHTASGALDLREVQGLHRQPYDTPVIGRIVGPENVEDVWWVQPGPPNDPLGVYNGVTYSVIPDLEFVEEGGVTDAFYRPIVGLWANKGSMRPNSQVVWFREGATLFLSYQSSNFSTMTQEQVSPSCLTSNLLNPIPLRGDFDGDNEMEIFFVSLGNGQHVFWRDTAAMWDPNTNAPCSNPDIAQIVAPHGTTEVLTKPFVGDFDGDDSDDIYWFSPNSDFASEIWLAVGAEGGPTIVPPTADGVQDPTMRDYTPVVGDFNGDFCDDILWYSPDETFVEDPNAPTGSMDTLGTSPLWRSICTPCGSNAWPGFEAQLEVVPAEAYPVGYDPRSAVRRADLDLCP